MFVEAVDLGEYETEHRSEDREHTEGENVPAPVLDQVMVPLGELPVTAAVHEVEEPTATTEGVQLTVVVVVELTGVVREPKVAPGITSLGG
jgi:hypothetical protein